MPTIAVDGRNTHFGQAGPADAAAAIVLLHAFPLNSGMWSAQLAGLGDPWRVIALDFRGFGGSAKTGPFTIEQLADDTHAFVKQLGLDKVVLGGISMGGYVALAYARKYTDTLRGLILLDTKAEPDSAEGKANRDRMIAIANERGSKPIADAMLGKLLSPSAVESRPQVVKEVRQMMESTSAETIAHALAAMRDRPDQGGLLPTIKVPTLIIVGAQDEVTPPEVARKMRGHMPGSQLKEIPAAGHLTPVEQPAQVNGAISAFVGSLA